MEGATDRARCGNLKKAAEASVAKDTTFTDYNENTMEMIRWFCSCYIVLPSST